MRFRKISIFVLSLLLFAGCALGEKQTGQKPDFGTSDVEYVCSKNTLVVGITDYAPMDYHEGGDWIGFDAELSNIFAESLGVKLELKEIDWEHKTELLEDGTIDCIWNGMTLTTELYDTISCSTPYLSNAQVVVQRRSQMRQYPTIEDCQHLLFVIEKGSAGETLIQEKKYRYNTAQTQLAALQSLHEMKADAAVIDIIMASYYINEQKDFDDLGFTISLNDETIGIGFRKGSDLTEKVNTFLQEAYEDGTMEALAQKYGIENALLK